MKTVFYSLSLNEPDISLSISDANKEFPLISFVVAMMISNGPRSKLDKHVYYNISNVHSC